MTLRELLPETNFELIPVKRVSRLRYGLGQPPEKKENGTPIIRATDIERGRINSESTNRVDPADVPPSREPFLSSGDIIVVRSGANTGDSAIIHEELDGAIVGYDIVVTPEQIDSSFLAWCFLSGFVTESQFQPVMLRAAQPHLNTEEVGDVMIPYPEISTQQEISDFLDHHTGRIDALIEKNQRLAKLLDERRQAFLTQAVTGEQSQTEETYGTEIEWLDKLPTDWKISSLKYQVSMESGMTPSTSESRYWQGEIPWFTAKDMKAEYLTDSKERLTYEAVEETGIDLLPPQTPIVVTRGMILDHTFPVGLTRRAATINQDMKALRAGDELEPEYLFRLMQGLAPPVLAMVEESAHGTKRLDSDRLRDLKIPIPPLQEQKRLLDEIDTELERLATLQEGLRTLIELLQEKRKALITAAVTGQIDVTDWQPPEKEITAEATGAIDH